MREINSSCWFLLFTVFSSVFLPMLTFFARVCFFCCLCLFLVWGLEMCGDIKNGRLFVFSVWSFVYDIVAIMHRGVDLWIWRKTLYNVVLHIFILRAGSRTNEAFCSNQDVFTNTRIYSNSIRIRKFLNQLLQCSEVLVKSITSWVTNTYTWPFTRKTLIEIRFCLKYMYPWINSTCTQ